MKIHILLLLILIPHIAIGDTITLNLTGANHVYVQDIEEPREINVPFFYLESPPEGYSMFDIYDVKLLRVNFSVHQTRNDTSMVDGTVRFVLHFYKTNPSVPFATYIKIIENNDSAVVEPDWDVEIIKRIGFSNRSVELKFDALLLIGSEDNNITTRADVTVYTYWSILFINQPEPLYPIEIVIYALIVGAVIGIPLFCCLIRRRRRNQIQTIQDEYQESRRESRRQKKKGRMYK